jgi:hypothetical protein
MDAYLRRDWLFALSEIYKGVSRGVMRRHGNATRNAALKN